MLNSVAVNFQVQPETNQVCIEAQCKVSGKTGVEMEALTAASVAALTIYDMCKAVDKKMVLENLFMTIGSARKESILQVVDALVLWMVVKFLKAQV